MAVRETAHAPRTIGRRLWWPCDVCGGVALPLRGGTAAPAPGRAVTGDLGELDLTRCPGCETRRHRHEPAGEDPQVWYDTWLEDWVVRLPCAGCAGGALLPMEIRFFDAVWAQVYRAAADLAYP